MKNFIKIAITGGIGSGKNIVAAKLCALGCKIFDSDTIVHELYENDASLKREIIAVFGKSVIDEKGTIIRSKLAAAAFSDEKNLERLNSIVHPRVKEYLEMIFSRLDDEHFSGCVAVMVPLLVEAGMTRDFDRVILVSADEEKRIERCMTRSRLSMQEIKSRMHFQLNDADKSQYADFIVDNNGSIENTEQQVEHIYNEIIQLIHKM